MALDMKTGELAPTFGNKGEVDVYKGVASDKVGESARDTFTIPNPVTVYKNLLISGARPGEGVAARTARRHPRVGRDHRQAGLELPHHSVAGRAESRGLDRRHLEGPQRLQRLVEPDGR